MADKLTAAEKITRSKKPKEEPMLALKLRRAYISPEGFRYRRVPGGLTLIPARYRDKLPKYLKEQLEAEE